MNMKGLENYNPLMLPFEETFIPSQAKQWFEEYWHLCFYIAIAYFILIAWLKKLMANKKPLSLNKALIVWNVGLATFSLLCFFRVLPEFLHTIESYGLEATICSRSFLTSNRVSSLWNFLFILSKLPELGDTLFIILRKTPLSFLHWYHHALTLVYSWYAFDAYSSTGRWFTLMNTFVHSFMYSYYAAKAMKIRIPKLIALLITSMQIAQMFVGSYVSYKAYHYLANNVPCGVTYYNVAVTFVMYFSYLLLFIQFFCKSYVFKNVMKNRKSL